MIFRNLSWVGLHFRVQQWRPSDLDPAAACHWWGIFRNHLGPLDELLRSEPERHGGKETTKIENTLVFFFGICAAICADFFHVFLLDLGMLLMMIMTKRENVPRTCFFYNYNYRSWRTCTDITVFHKDAWLNSEPLQLRTIVPVGTKKGMKDFQAQSLSTNAKFDMEPEKGWKRRIVQKMIFMWCFFFPSPYFWGEVRWAWYHRREKKHLLMGKHGVWCCSKGLSNSHQPLWLSLSGV